MLLATALTVAGLLVGRYGARDGISSKGTSRWEATPHEEGQERAPGRAWREAVGRLAWLRLALAAGLVMAMLLSPNLWVSARSYPLTPLWDAAPPLPYPADYALFGLFLALVAGVGIARGRAMGWLAAGALVL